MKKVKANNRQNSKKVKANKCKNLKKVKADVSIFHDFAFVIAEREIVWRLIIEVGIEIRDAVGQEGMIDHAQPLKEVLRVAVSN